MKLVLNLKLIYSQTCIKRSP